MRSSEQGHVGKIHQVESSKNRSVDSWKRKDPTMNSEKKGPAGQ